MKTSLLITLLILISILLGVGLMSKINHQNALLNEYEYILAAAWADKQECRDQLGVFYMDEK